MGRYNVTNVTRAQNFYVRELINKYGRKAYVEGNFPLKEKRLLQKLKRMDKK